MSIFRATDWDGQVLHGATVQELGEKTSRHGTASTLWDVHELDSDRQAGPKYVGYMVGGQVQAPEPEGWRDGEDIAYADTDPPELDPADIDAVYAYSLGWRAEPFSRPEISGREKEAG
jgi:hypothetical protein